MKNKNPNNQNFKTTKIEVRGNRKVKDFSKLELTPEQIAEGFTIKDNCLYDKDNNYWDLAIFSIDRAIKSSKSLTNCKNCVNCANSEECYSCVNCRVCTYCKDCYNCHNCHNCHKTANMQYFDSKKIKETK